MAQKVTNIKIASKASKILRDNRFSKIAKSVAGSALSQCEKNKKRKYEKKYSQNASINTIKVGGI